MLRRSIQDLAEAGRLALLVGAVCGISMVALLSGSVGESSSESLEALVLGSLQLVTPVGVSLIWSIRCAPVRLAVAVRRQLNRAAPGGTTVSGSWSVPLAELGGAACSAVLLVPWFQVGLLLGGVLTTPRAGLGLSSELQELTRLITVSDLLRCLLRSAVLAAAAGWVCLRKAGQARGSESELARLLADALPESLLAVMALEVIWLTLLVPLHGTYA